jgi:hypothetical protein
MRYNIINKHYIRWLLNLPRPLTQILYAKLIITLKEKELSHFSLILMRMGEIQIKINHFSQKKENQSVMEPGKVE